MTAEHAEWYRSAYEGFEQLGAFPDRYALDEYRRLLLEKTEDQVRFISRWLGSGPHRVLEFCSGNGRLLVALARAGLLLDGTGIEISSSRVAFARRWADDVALTGVDFAVGDVLDAAGTPRQAFQVVVCITGAFGYFRAIDDIAPATVLRRTWEVLEPGGSLLLELYQLTDEQRTMFELNRGCVRSWQALPPEDRFAYYLSERQLRPDCRSVRHEKTFVGRDGSIDSGHAEELGFYSRAELVDLLAAHGFRDVRCFADFTGRQYEDGRSPALVVLASKRT